MIAIKRNICEVPKVAPSQTPPKMRIAEILSDLTSLRVCVGLVLPPSVDDS